MNIAASLRRAPGLLLAAACLPLALGAHARGVKLPGMKPFTAEVTIDADGRAIVSEVTGIQGPFAEALRSQLQALHFEPARVDGAAVASATHVYANAVLSETKDGDVEVRVGAVRTGPRMRLILPPMYPAEMARRAQAGSVLVVFTVGADGKPQGVRYVGATDERFQAEVERVVGRWRFVPEVIAGRPSRDAVAVPVWFHPWQDKDKPTFACPAAGDRPHIAGTDGCLDMIELTYQHAGAAG